MYIIFQFYIYILLYFVQFSFIVFYLILGLFDYFVNLWYNLSNFKKNLRNIFMLYFVL